MKRTDISSSNLTSGFSSAPQPPSLCTQHNTEDQPNPIINASTETINVKELNPINYEQMHENLIVFVWSK